MRRNTTGGPRAQDAWLTALGESTRLAIVRGLARGDKTVTVLAQECNFKVANVSHHLRIMKSAGLVTVARASQFMRYALVGAQATLGGVELVHPSGLKVFVPLDCPGLSGETEVSSASAVLALHERA